MKIVAKGISVRVSVLPAQPSKPHRHLLETVQV